MDTSFLDAFGTLPIDIIMIALVLLSGIFQNKYFSEWKFNAAWKTLIVSFVFCSIYAAIYFIQHGNLKDMLMKWFFSYVVATSLYELLMKRFMKKLFPEEENTK
jgi:Na+/H+-dicarboxylate symporter